MCTYVRLSFLMLKLDVNVTSMFWCLKAKTTNPSYINKNNKIKSHIESSVAFIT